MICLGENYQTLSEVGSGSFGTVYKVRNKETMEIFAIKKTNSQSKLF